MNLFTKASDEKSKNLHRILLIVFLGTITNIIVFTTGGTKGAWAQLNLLVIFGAAYFWKLKGGLLTALILGLIVGPLMPLDVEYGIMQTTGNWVFRTLIYLSSAYIAGYTFKRNEEINQQIKNKDLISQLTGLYNTNKMFYDLTEMLENKKEFCLIFFNVINLEEISKYVDQEIIGKAIRMEAAARELRFEGSELYSGNFNEYILILKDYEKNDIIRVISNYIKDISDPRTIEDFSIQLIVKTGIVFNNNDGTKATEIYNKARITADQGENHESGVYIYDSDFENKRKLFYEISNSMQNAIEKNEFYIVYQPIINLNNNTISSSEVLVRWNRSDRKAIGPSTFIKIAEETGSIQKITMEVVKQLINQLSEWKKSGIEIKSSVNFTAGELIDDSFREWAKKIIHENDIASSSLGIEITERVFYKNGKKLNDVLLELQNKGYSVFIDDFGTGYNTLKLVEDVKADVIKIDKCFIDRMDRKRNKLLIRHIIECAHENGLSVIAEGVEKKEQLMALRELECDMIQGYYFSKPLLADDFIEYYKSFDINNYI